VKWLGIIILLLLWNTSNAQVLSQTYVDPCSGKVLTVTVPIASGSVTVVYRGQYKVVTANDITTGALTAWLNMLTTAYPCPETQQVVNQVVTQTVNTAVSAAVNQATASATAAATAAAT
jgi:hypothetical protein